MQVFFPGFIQYPWCPQGAEQCEEAAPGEAGEICLPLQPQARTAFDPGCDKANVSETSEHICDGRVTLFLSGRVPLFLANLRWHTDFIPRWQSDFTAPSWLLWCNCRIFDVLQGALERGCLVLSSPILSALFSLLPFPFSSACWQAAWWKQIAGMLH